MSRRKNQNSWKMVSNDMYRVMAIVTELPSDGGGCACSFRFFLFFFDDMLIRFYDYIL